MSLVLRSFLIFAAITCSVHEIAEGQTLGCLKHIFCHRCRRYDCGCAQPLAVAAPPAVCAPVCPVPPPTQTVGPPVAQSCVKTCTTVHPVVETRYRQENFMTYRTECRTAVRQEAYCQTVPVTHIENVTRDEGCYQMVWVPKPVTRQVCKTTYQQRTAYRNVPYQYQVQVPEMKCRVVPQQSVRYVQQTHTFAEPMTPICPPVPSCAAPVFAPAAETAAYPPPIAPTYAAPSCEAPAPVPLPAGAPAAQNGTPWTPVPQRATTDAEVQGMNYLPVAARPYEQAASAAAQIPSAAAAWQTRR